MRELRRIGKRIAIGVEGELWLVLHLMIAGRCTGAAGAKLAAAKIWQPSIFPTAPWSNRSGHQAPRIFARIRGEKSCAPSIREGSTFSPATSSRFERRSLPKTAR